MIVNPAASTPYPGTLGMEKEKPYRCDYCAKCYRNLNGLMYHGSHSTHPNTPSLPLAALYLLGVAMPVPGQHQPVAGGIMGKSGIGIK